MNPKDLNKAADILRPVMMEVIQKLDMKNPHFSPSEVLDGVFKAIEKKKLFQTRKELFIAACLADYLINMEMGNKPLDQEPRKVAKS